MKILIYVPTHPHKPYVHPQTIDSIFNLSWTEPLQIVFDHQNWQGINTDNIGRNNLLAKLKRAREMVLTLGYDALLTVEFDIVIPRITLERLTRVPADVAYGLYVSRSTNHQWLAFTEFHEMKNRGFNQTPGLCQKSWGQVVESAGVGTGCTLIHRNVLEKTPFRIGPAHKSPDTYLGIDCCNRGFTQMHDMGVVCGHINREGTEIYWPAEDGGYKMEMIA